MMVWRSSILEILPREIVFMMTSYLDPVTLLNFIIVMQEGGYYNEFPIKLGLELIRQSGIHRIAHRPHEMWRSILEWEKADYIKSNEITNIKEVRNCEKFLEHIRDRMLSWKCLGSMTIDEPFKYLQFKIDKVIRLIQGDSDPTIRQMTRKDQLVMISLIIEKILKEFTVEVAWTEENEYEGVRTPQNSHEDLCECITNVPYPKEALRVEYKNHTYLIDTEGYMLCSRVPALYSTSILEWNASQGLGNIPWVIFKEGIFYMEVEGTSALPCDHRHFHNRRQESLIDKLTGVMLARTSKTIGDPEHGPWDAIKGLRTFWDTKTETGFKSTHRLKFPDNSYIFLLTKEEDLTDNEPELPTY